MAAKDAKLKRKISFLHLKKLQAGVSLLAFLIMLISGMMAGNSIITITQRSFLAIVVIMVITRVVVSILVTYEEMHSDEA